MLYHRSNAAMQPTSILAAVFFAAKSAHRLVSFFFHAGLIGLFFISAVDSSFIPLPLPGITDIMIVVYAANKTNVIYLVLIATLGSAAGGLFSHAVGQAGGMAFLEKNVPARILKRVTTWMEDHAILAVAVPALLPPPMPLSPFVLAAGALHMSRRKFMTAFTISRFLRHCIAAWLGLRYGHAVIVLWSRFSARWGTTILVTLWSVIVLFTGIAIWRLVKTSRELELNQKFRRKPATST
jgi:membrane protein YqaA with SNARE-associated domain